jgi:carboxyl-terminal processing protease
LLQQGVEVSELFLDPGQGIVSMQGRVRDMNRNFGDQQPQPWKDLPIVLLVDRGSASASEIVAGALQDHDRAVVVGGTTFGKGSAQSVYPVENAGALKLTTARWFTPAGRSISKQSATPSDDDEDGVAADSARRTYKTDAGRIVRGGGGIAPDVVVADTVGSYAEALLVHALGKQLPLFRDALTDMARSLRSTGAVGNDFSVTPALRDDLYRRLQERGVKLSRVEFDAAEPSLNRQIATEVARYALPSGPGFIRMTREDPAISVALDLATGARDMQDLLQRAKARQDSATKAQAKKDSTSK